jgi:S1-C subfamily serine protease
VDSLPLAEDNSTVGHMVVRRQPVLLEGTMTTGIVSALGRFPG